MLKQNKDQKNEIYKIIQKYPRGVSRATIKSELTGQAPQEKREMAILEKRRDKKIKEWEKLKVTLYNFSKLTNWKLRESTKIKGKRDKQNKKTIQLNQEIGEINKKVETLKKRVEELKLNPFCTTIPLSTLHKYLNELITEGLIVRITAKTNGKSTPLFGLSCAELSKLYYGNKLCAEKLKRELESKEREYNAAPNSYAKQWAEAKRNFREEVFGEKINPPTLEEIEKLKQELKKCQSDHSFDLTGYGGRNGVHNIKDREKAKELFDVYLHILTRQVSYSVLLAVKQISFSPESKVIIERLKNGDYWFDVRRDIAKNVVSQLQKVFASPTSGMVIFVLELLANADVAFGNAIGDPKSSVNQFLEWYCTSEEIRAEYARLSQDVCKILSQPNAEGYVPIEKDEAML
ncbi:MAG: hypothetical protein FWF27_04915 [Candidatus Bathyarchaeota archaeon]|nr:hypothetical protein [Candidatus Termiticorpusculum sp.]